MSCPILEQDPLDKRVVIVDFSDWLDAGVNISSVAWVIDSALTQSDLSNDTSSATCYISGGSDGGVYDCACTITTDEAAGRKKTQRFQISVTSECT